MTHFLIWTPDTSSHIKKKQKGLSTPVSHSKTDGTRTSVIRAAVAHLAELYKGVTEQCGWQPSGWLAGVLGELWRPGRDKDEYGLETVNPLANSPDQTRPTSPLPQIKLICG